MGDRFDDLAERVQLDCESYVMRGSIDGRKRLIREALVAAHAIGKEEADEALVRGMDQMRMLSKLPLPIEIVDDITRLRAENARLREAMPTAKERDAIELASLACDRASSSTIRAATDAVDAWLARLDAAKGVR